MNSLNISWLISGAEVMLAREGSTVQDGELQGVLQAEHRSGGRMVVLWKFMT